MASQLTISSGVLDAQGLQELGALTSYVLIDYACIYVCLHLYIRSIHMVSLVEVYIALVARHPEPDSAEQGRAVRRSSKWMKGRGWASGERVGEAHRRFPRPWASAGSRASFGFGLFGSA